MCDWCLNEIKCFFYAGDIYENSDKIMKGHHTDKIYANKESNAAREKSKNGQSPESKQVFKYH